MCAAPLALAAVQQDWRHTGTCLPLRIPLSALTARDWPLQCRYRVHGWIYMPCVFIPHLQYCSVRSYLGMGSATTARLTFSPHFSRAAPAVYYFPRQLPAAAMLPLLGLPGEPGCSLAVSCIRGTGYRTYRSLFYSSIPFPVLPGFTARCRYITALLRTFPCRLACRGHHHHPLAQTPANPVYRTAAGNKLLPPSSPRTTARLQRQRLPAACRSRTPLDVASAAAA